LASAIQDRSPKSETHVCDVSDTGGYRARLAAVETDHGRVDVLINNAAVEQRTAVDGPDGQLDAYQRLFATNVFGVVAGTLAVLPGMLARRGGIVVNVSSDSARAPEPREGAYAASEAAVAAFTVSVADGLADR